MRDYLYVEDHARGIDCALRHGSVGMDYNIGAGGETDGVTVADTVLRLLDKPRSLKQFVRDRPGHDRRYALDSTRLSALGWRPEITFEAGMERADRQGLASAGFVALRNGWRPLSGGAHRRVLGVGSTSASTGGGATKRWYEGTRAAAIVRTCAARSPRC